MSSQKYITRNRPPRVHITYEVYTGDAMKKVELPFIAMVMSDLSGKSAAELPAVADRKSIDIHADNFDQVLKSQKPRVSFLVDNHLTGEGQLPVDIKQERSKTYIVPVDDPQGPKGRSIVIVNADNRIERSKIYQTDRDIAKVVGRDDPGVAVLTDMPPLRVSGGN